MNLMLINLKKYHTCEWNDQNTFELDSCRRYLATINPQLRKNDKALNKKH